MKRPGRTAAVAWLARQPWFAEWNDEIHYLAHREAWRRVADAVRENGFYSMTTLTIDVPVALIVRQARALRDTKDAPRHQS